MSKNNVSRVHYFEKQFLRTQDFIDEQAYHIAMRRRHNIAHHTWGIVRGLEITDEEGKLFIQPGMAIDGYGRDVILQEIKPVDMEAFQDKNNDVLDVWLEYDRLTSDPAPKGYTSCGDDVNDSPYRYQENPLIRYTVPDSAFLNRREPETVPQGDLKFDSTRTSPDDPQQDWPVFLGQIQKLTEKTDQPTYKIFLDGRPYIGLVGEKIIAPTGLTEVRFDTENDDGNSFAVFLGETDKTKKQPGIVAIKKNGENGELDIHGSTSIHGNLTVKNGAIEFCAGTAIDPQNQKGNQPWSIFKNEKKKNGNGNKTHELRIVMGDKNEDCVVIGTWSDDDKSFKPCLTICHDGKVIVHGDLIVRGQINEIDSDNNVKKYAINKLSKSRPLSPEAKSAAIGALQSGIAGAAFPIGTLLLSAMAQGKIPAMMADSENNVKQFAESFAKQEASLIHVFVEKIIEKPEMAELLRDHITKRLGEQRRRKKNQ